MYRIILLFLFISTSILGQNNRSICPVYPFANERTQPDGSKITLIGVGNEMVNYLETKDGYTVLENKTGYFEYGTLNQNGDLVASGIKAHNGNIISAKNITTHLRYSANQLAVLGQLFEQQTNQLNKKAGGKPFPSKGKRNVLTLLVQYPDLPAVFSKSNFDSLMVKPNYNATGSFRDYYLKTSFGQLELNTDVYGWFIADSSYMYYGKSNSSYMQNVAKMIKKAVLQADSNGIDFTKYDNDKDGYVDGIIIMHSGIGAEETSAPNAGNTIWSHRSNLSNSGGTIMVDGVIVDAYGCFPEKRYNGGAYSQVGIGVICHEFGHILDLPDLYATNQLSEGAGDFAIMAGGPWLNNEHSPCLHDAWSRINLGWLTPTIIDATGTYTINQPVSDSNFCYQINTNLANEYFLLENRQKRGFDTYLPAKGLAVWHINSSKAKLLSVSGGNNVNNDTSNYGVGLIQADGRRDLEKGNNRGDYGDLYPGSNNNHNIGNYTIPSTNLNTKIGGLKQLSNITISNITQNADSSVTFNFGNKASAGFNASVIKGCAPLKVFFDNTSAFANKFRWKLEDGSLLDSENVNRLFVKSGKYLITLFILDSFNRPIDSASQEITVDASPIAKFDLVRGDSNTFVFTNKSENFLYVVWRFGNNQTSTALDPIYTITTSQKVPFMLIAYSQNLCSDTAFGVMDYWPASLNEIAKNLNFNCFPNPFSDELNIAINATKSQELSIKMFDVLGALIENFGDFKIKEGENKFKLYPKLETKGVYFIELKSNDFKKILRVIGQ